MRLLHLLKAHLKYNSFVQFVLYSNLTFIYPICWCFSFLVVTSDLPYYLLSSAFWFIVWMYNSIYCCNIIKTVCSNCQLGALITHMCVILTNFIVVTGRVLDVLDRVRPIAFKLFFSLLKSPPVSFHRLSTLHGARWLAETPLCQRLTNQRGPRLAFSLYFCGGRSGGWAGVFNGQTNGEQLKPWNCFYSVSVIYTHIFLSCCQSQFSAVVDVACVCFCAFAIAISPHS